jgi:hypothetical protein
MVAAKINTGDFEMHVPTSSSNYMHDDDDDLPPPLPYDIAAAPGPSPARNGVAGWEDEGDPDAPPAIATQVDPTLRPQPYQKTVSFLVHPFSPIQRLLVAHRTGAGKTYTMIRVLDNFFYDKRPKVVIFPTQSIANSFYLVNPLQARV